MVYVPLEKLLEQSGGSIYKLVNLASKRAQEITEGQPWLVEADRSTKPSTVALYEIAGGRIKIKGKVAA